MPITIRAGIVRATFKIISDLSWALVRSNDSFINTNKGAWLNHTKKEMKNATQVMCSVLILPLFRSNKFNPCDDESVDEDIMLGLYK